jgi:hypothetical protein
MLDTPEKVQAIHQAAEAFIGRCEPLYRALKMFSDASRKPLACSVHTSLRTVEEYCRLDSATSEAWDHHIARLQKKHDMDFWALVRWFHPRNVLLSDETDPVPSAEQMQAMLGGSLSNFINPAEWDEYKATKGFQYDHKHEGEWWEKVGQNMFPTLYRAAVHVVWIQPVVTQCDSLLSTLDAKYSDRQACLGTKVVQNGLFIRCNGRRLLPEHEEVDNSSDAD